MEHGLTILAIGLFLYAITAKRLSSTVFTGPLLFASLGWAIGPEGLELIEAAGELEIVTLLLESTLVLVLFTDAMGTNSSHWRENASIPGRLLSVGLPLTLLAGWGTAAVLFGDLGVWEAGLIAIILTPTDAALGQAVVSNPRVPERIRGALSIESGLNDGLALPIFFVFLEAAEAAETSVTVGTILGEIVKEVGIALATGLVIGWLATKLIGWTHRHDWITPGWLQISLVGVAFVAWALADGLGGSGFLAAWVAGFLMGHMMRDEDLGRAEFAEDTSRILTPLSFFAFGTLLLGQTLDIMTWEAAIYAVLSLTLIRIIPVAISMIGTGLQAPSVLYLGWFGPRGLASIILVATIVAESELAGSDTIQLIMVATVGLSIYAHGLTASWGASRYADWYESHRDDDPDAAEAEQAADSPVSRRIDHDEPSDA